MQANVGSSSKTSNGDWDPAKIRIGLTENKIPTPTESVNAGILWLYWKGVSVLSVEYTDGKVSGGDVQWTGGADWGKALERFNGGGDANYMEKFNAILDALKTNSTKDYVEEQKPK